MPLVDVKFFVTAVMLQRETGGNLAEILDNLSYVIRERFKIQRQVRVYTAQGRLTMLVACTLDASGNIKNPRVLDPGPAQMTAKVLAALRTWKFQPAMCQR